MSQRPIFQWFHSSNSHYLPKITADGTSIIFPVNNVNSNCEAIENLGAETSIVLISRNSGRMMPDTKSRNSGIFLAEIPEFRDLRKNGIPGNRKFRNCNLLLSPTLDPFGVKGDGISLEFSLSIQGYPIQGC
jgi:hypothetical protein